MPRDANGNYVLPLADVITGTLITSTWANTTMDDLAAAMTDSLSRAGNGAMQAPLRHTSGAVNQPSSSFNEDQLTGIYLDGVGDMRATVLGTDRMRWLPAGELPQIWDSDNLEWNDIGAGGVTWIHSPTLPAEVVTGKGYVTAGGEFTDMPANPVDGHSIAFADLNDDWSETNFITLNGNGNNFTQDGTDVYTLNLKGAFAQFSWINGEWEIVNFGRLSDAYGVDLQNYARLDELPNPNLLINGNFDIWQRNTSFSAIVAVYTADRWISVVAGGTVTVDREEFIIGQIDVPHNPSFYTRSTADGSVINVGNDQRIEGVRTLADETITISFYARSSAATSINLDMVNNYGSGGSPAELVANASRVISSTFERQEVTFTLPSISGKSIGEDNYVAISMYVDSLELGDTLDIAQVKIEYGSVATAFKLAGENIAGELAMCQRYFQKWGGHAAGDELIGILTVYTANTGYLSLRPIVTMRGIPNISTSPLADFLWAVAGDAGAPTSLTLNNLQNNSAELVIGGVVGANGSSGFFRVSAPGFIYLVAEL